MTSRLISRCYQSDIALCQSISLPVTYKNIESFCHSFPVSYINVDRCYPSFLCFISLSLSLSVYLSFCFSLCLCYFLMGQPRPLFVYFRSFPENNTIFTTNQCEKMSIQYQCTAPGFEPMTF